MKLKYNFVINEVAGKTVAVAVGEGMSEFNGFIKMNETGAEIFKILKNDVSKEDIVLKLKEIYPDENEQALKSSVEGFIDELKKFEVLSDV